MPLFYYCRGPPRLDPLPQVFPGVVFWAWGLGLPGRSMTFSSSRWHRPWVGYALLTAMTLALLLARGEQSLMAYDEGWYAQQARWIAETGDWVTQHWWFQPLYDRAMGVQWLIALSYRLVGVSEAAARLPSAVACWASVLLLYSIGCQVMPRPQALLGAAILAVTPVWMQAAGLATQDIPLIALELLGIWALLRAENSPNHRWAWGLLAGSWVGLGFTVKSFMVVPAVVALLPYLVIEQRRHRHLTNGGLYLGLGLGFVPTLVWWGLSMVVYGWFPLTQLFRHLFYLSETDYHRSGVLYYLWNLPVVAFPWPLLALPGIGLALRARTPDPYRRRLLWLGYPAVLLLELTLFTTRTWYYGMQLLPFVALLASVTLSGLAGCYGTTRRRWVTGVSWGLAAIATALVVAGLAIVLDPGRLPVDEGRAYGAVGLALGLGWLVPGGMDWVLCRDPKWGGDLGRGLWAGGWLVGVGLAIATLYGTSLWGNYDEGVKTQLAQPPFAPVLAQHAVDFWLDPANRPAAADADLAVLAQEPYQLFLEDKAVILLTVNTPKLGRPVLRREEVTPGYVWARPAQVAELDPNRAVQVVGTIHGWQLVRVGP